MTKPVAMRLAQIGLKKGHHEGITNRSKNVIIEDEEEHEDEHEGRQLSFVIRTRRRPRSRYIMPRVKAINHKEHEEHKEG